MVQLFGPKALKGNIETCTAIFPNVKVTKNDKWIISRSLGSIMSIKTESNYTLQNITEDAFVIHGDEVIEPENSDDYTEVSGIPMKYTINGTSTSDIKIDKKSGWVTEAKITQSMKGQLDVKDNLEAPGGMTIPANMHTELIITGK